MTSSDSSLSFFLSAKPVKISCRIYTRSKQIAYQVDPLFKNPSGVLGLFADEMNFDFLMEVEPIDAVHLADRVLNYIL